MNAMDHQEAWAMKPRKLSIEELERPEQVIREFFEFAEMPEVRWHLWELMKTAVTGNFPQLRTRERVTMFCFYERIEKLIEATHVLNERGRK